MINEQSKDRTGKTPQTCPLLQQAASQRDTNEEVQERIPEGLPTAAYKALSLGLTVKQVAACNKWISSQPLSPHLQNQALGPFVLTAVSSTLYQHPSVTLLAVSSLIS